MGDDNLKVSQPPNRPEMPETHYTLQEAAEEIEVSILSLQTAIAEGLLPCLHQYGRCLITASDLEMHRLRVQDGLFPR